MKEKEVLREYAKCWVDCAFSPAMAERKRIWTAVNDLHQIRPAVLVETCLMTDYVTPNELLCTDEYLKQIEKYMIENVRHASEVGDDFVLEPYLRIPWELSVSGFGVEILEKHATDTFGDTVACTFEHPIKTIRDISTLRPREFSVDKEATNRKLDLLNVIFGDVLPVVAGGVDPVYGSGGYSPFCGLHITEITLNLYKLIGMNNIYFWLYDNPETIHVLMKFVLDDFLEYHRFLETEGLLAYNGDNTLVGGRYGYSSNEIPANDLTLKDLWLWGNAEETTSLSPEMYAEFILPYLKQAMEPFGKIYFGCCETMERIWERVQREVAGLKAVSVSPFSDVNIMGELVGKKYVFSKKPQPSYMSQPTPDMKGAKKDIHTTLAATKNCNLEIIMRDIYRTHGNRKVLSDWVEMVHSLL